MTNTSSIQQEALTLAEDLDRLHPHPTIKAASRKLRDMHSHIGNIRQYIAAMEQELERVTKQRDSLQMQVDALSLDLATLSEHR